MKVLLFQPPIEDYYTTPIRNYPLGLLFIASKIYDICDVEIIDLRRCKKPTTIETPFKELKEYYTPNYSPFSLFHRYYRFGLSKGDIEKLIKEKKPEIVGISCLFSTYFDEALDVAKIIKNSNKSTLTVLGGNHPTLFPEEVLKNSCIDFVIRGEGEHPFRMLVERISKNSDISEIPGICYRKSGEIIISESYFSKDTSLSLKRELLKKEDYPYGKGFVAPVLTSKGCPYNCYFCGKPKTQFRFFSADDVKKDIAKLLYLGFDTIDFEDDYLDLTTPNMIKLLTWIKTLNIKLTAMNGVVPKINDEVKKLIREAGFQRVNISLVDVSEELRKEVNRAHFKGFDTVLEDFISTSVPVETHFIIGMPSQNLENIISTLIYLAERKVLLGPSVYYLSPGSPAFSDFTKENFTFQTKYARSSAIFPVNRELDRDKIVTLMKLTRFINFIKKWLDLQDKDVPIAELLKDLPVIDKEIVSALIKERKVISYNKNKQNFEVDRFSNEVLDIFFSRIKFITGYKTGNICLLK